MSEGNEDQVSMEDKMKLYEVLMCKIYAKGDTLCEYGTRGDRFYIILKGEISVRQPKEVELTFNTTWELFNHVLTIFEQISSFRDPNSKECGFIIGLIGPNLLRSLKFNDVRKLDAFLFKLSHYHDETFEIHKTLNR